MIQGQTFDEVYARVAARHDEMLPDKVVHLSDLKLTPEGHLTAPGMPQLRLNPWARKQLASMIGIRWDKWFASTTGEERAQEVTRRLSRLPGERKIRAWRDPSGEANGIARAILSANFTPIGDERIFERMALMLRGLVTDYRFTRVVYTDETTHYTAVHLDAFDQDGDLLHPGWHLRNSDVGASALSLDDYFLRLVCTNGLMVRVGGKRSLYRTHRSIEDDQLAAALMIAIGRLPERWQTIAGFLSVARKAMLPHPDDAVVAILSDSADVAKELVEKAQRHVLADGDHSRFGVVQAITYVAHAETTEPDVRFAMERLAGDYLAATSAEA